MFNIASGVETSARGIFDGLAVHAGQSVEPHLAPLRPGELERSCLDSARAGRELGWRAEIPLAEGLRDTYRALVEEFGREPASDAASG